MLIGIFGTGRNGSTLLGRLLDGLGATFVHPVEENFLSVLNDLLEHGRVRRLTGQNCTVKPLRRLAGSVPRTLLAAAYQNSLNTLQRLLATNIPNHVSAASFKLETLLPETDYQVATFVGEYLMAAAKICHPGVEFINYLFKSIETPYIADYERVFPDMRFVHIFRDPVVVCSSQKRSLMQTKCYPATYLGHDWLVSMIDKRWIPHARAVLARRDNSRHVVVRYEDLVADPAATIGRIACGLGVNAPPRPHMQTIFADRDFQELDYNPSKAGIRTPREALTGLREKFGYEEVLTEREIDFINYKTAALQEQLGYTPSSKPALIGLLAQYAYVDSWETANVRGFGGVARALYGMAYRRAAIFRC